MNVPFLDLSRQNNALAEDLTAAQRRVIVSGRVLYGPELEAFEHEMASWLGVAHCVGVASGTDAVEIALRCVGVGPGDKVATTAFTAVPTINAIEATGAEPALVDIESDGNADHSSWEIGGEKAVLAVSLYGRAASMTERRAEVEDIAHALGATDVDECLAGTRGLVGAVSFYPTKNLGALGDGGAIVTDNDAIAARARDIRHYGMVTDGNVRMRGQNSRLSELQAAFLRVKLPHLRAWNERRRAIAKRYEEDLFGRVRLLPPDEGHVHHVFVVRHQERDRIRAGLDERGIGTMIHYPRAIHEHARWQHLGVPGEFTMAEEFARTVLSLPCYPELRDDEQDAVIAALRDLT